MYNKWIIEKEARVAFDYITKKYCGAADAIENNSPRLVRVRLVYTFVCVCLLKSLTDAIL